MPVVARTAEQKVRELQHTLYRAAKAEPSDVFTRSTTKSTAGTLWSVRGGRGRMPSGEGRR